ncbi:hypothetical protein AX16_003391 [Volvariella volvacea WC 439]|nr:hypothetical protein AX16_003391 [Volvariella volvacea WC 439]
MSIHSGSQSLGTAVNGAPSTLLDGKEAQSGNAQCRHRNVLSQPRVYMPVVIILGQSILLLGGWAFYAATRVKPTPLPDYLATAMQDAPQPATFVITQIATILSILTSFLYSHAIRYTVAMSLSQPMSLFALAASMKIAGKSPILDFQRWKWTIAALVCVAALSTQTAGWTTLLTPGPIQIRTLFTGFGVDLSNEQFIEKTVEDYNSNALQPLAFLSISPLLVDSGVTAVSALYNQTSNFNFNEMTYYRSTAGILPLNLVELLSTVGHSTSAVLPVTVNPPSPIHVLPGFPANYTVMQQGLTADIHCEQRMLDENTTPSVVGPMETPINNDSDQNLVSSWVDFVCRDGTSASSGHTVESIDDTGIIFANLCILNNQMEYELILVGSGNYEWIGATVCSISPKITLVNAHYSQGSLSTFDTVRVDAPRESKDIPAAGFAAASIISDALYNLAVNQANETEIVNKILEIFLTGAFEFSATLIRASYTETGNEFWGEIGTPIPEEFRYTINGAFLTHTIGWHQVSSALPWVLLAPTFVTSISIALVVVTLVRTPKRTEVDGQDYFDLNNILHVIAASSVGGFNEPFPSLDADNGDHSSHSEKVKVKLGYAKSGLLGLVQQSDI